MASKRTKMKFSKKIIIVMFTTMILFTLTCFITFWKFQSVPDALIEPFFAFFGIEGGALGIIKVSETIADKIEIKKKAGKKK